MMDLGVRIIYTIIYGNMHPTVIPNIYILMIRESILFAHFDKIGIGASILEHRLNECRRKSAKIL